MRLNGRYGQVHDVEIPAGQDLLGPGGLIDVQTPETTRPVIYKLGIIAPEGTLIQINDSEMKISSSGIFELDYVVEVDSLIFPNGAPDTTIIDYVY